MSKEKIFKLVQEYLKECNTIIWGSGATIPYGLPSMRDLKNELQFKDDKKNLEEILSEIQDEEKLNKYNQKIFKFINKKDKEFKEKVDKNTFNGIKKIIKFFYRTCPQCINIITTNYDCVLEYFLSFYKCPFSDGFSGREFSEFNETNFKEKEHINLYKVHGSLRWNKDRYCYDNKSMQAIYPNKNKFEQAHYEPFRSLISKSDNVIKKSKSILVIGFGFNDVHLTPKITEALKNNDIQIVVVTRKATDEIKEMQQQANEMILIEEYTENNTTKVSYKEEGVLKDEKLQGSFWKLEEFNSILMK